MSSFVLRRVLTASLAQFAGKGWGKIVHQDDTVMEKVK